MISFTMQYPKTKQGRTQFFKKFGLNGIYSGKHWRQRQEDAREWHWMVLAELNQQSIPNTIYTEPVEITFYWDDRLDIDNHALMAKLTVDALKGHLLQDDGRRNYGAVHRRFWDGGCMRVEISAMTGDSITAEMVRETRKLK